MKKTKPYKIVALVSENEVFITKTFGKRVSAFYNRYCREYIRQKANKKPKLHVLFKSEIQTFEAYRFVLAYTHIFQEAGYRILNSQRTIDRAADLHPATRLLVDQIREESIEDLLARTLVRNPTEADEKESETVDLNTEDTANHKLTIRVTEEEKCRFANVAHSLGLNQRQTIQYLISKSQQADPFFVDINSDEYLGSLISAYAERIEKLEKTNEELRDRIKKQRIDTNERISKIKKQRTALQMGILEYFRLMESASSMPLDIELGNYQDFEQADQYEYPEEDGIYLLRVTEVLRGKGRYPALFVLGIGDEGRCYKFRYYPQESFAGVSICNQKFAKRVSVWLIGCERVADGAMNLTQAYPLEIAFRYKNPEEYQSKMARDITDLMREVDRYNNF